MNLISRKSFLRVGAAAAASLMIRPFAQAEPGASKFYFAIIADTHIIDPFYKGPEGSPEDTESIFKTSERLTAARSLINSLQPRMEKVFLVGDYFHNYPSSDVDFYFKNETRLDKAKELTDAFTMPVHVGFGNHDYSTTFKLSREHSHELFRRKFGLQPYYAVEHQGWKFIHLNNFTGETWHKENKASFKPSVGSLGENQLNWFEAELQENKPSFVFIHFPLSIVQPAEFKDYGLYSLLKRNGESIQRVISGHWHRWVDFGRQYGPQHLVMAATRYDSNAYLIVEADKKAVSHQLLNIDLVQWNTHYSAAYKGHV
ncbi:MAG TPA: metallophosphoesterase [Verrucomicrobiae bacterium]|nr:metallophosphoesterase [Verrucomicrobiae bacterium]